MHVIWSADPATRRRSSGGLLSASAAPSNRNGNITIGQETAATIVFEIAGHQRGIHWRYREPDLGKHAQAELAADSLLLALEVSLERAQMYTAAVDSAKEASIA